MNIFEFSEIDSFLENFKPLTPYGKASGVKRKLINSKPELEKEFYLTDILLCFIKKNSNKIPLIENALKRIPIINLAETYDYSDIFLVKKFLANYSKVAYSVDDKIKANFSLNFESSQLLDYLNIDKSDDDSFYISSSYSEDLKSIRLTLKQIDYELQQLKKNRLAYIFDTFRLDFRFKDFLVIDEKKAATLDKTFFFLEAYDSENVVIKPILPDEYFHLHSQRDIVADEEKSIECVIISEISSKITEEIPKLRSYISAVAKFDIMLAKARLAEKYNMVKPNINELGSSIAVKNGRYIPLLNKCKKLQTNYTYVNCVLDSRVSVVNGSNMGGKTMFLKSVAFFQLLTQLGFFVPSEKFDTVVFDEIAFIGENSKDNIEGLSSFGLEINSFTEFYKNISKNSLVFMDEFARTTNSLEAKALLTSILCDLASRNNIYALVSTHFMDISAVTNVNFYKMKGLNYDDYVKIYIDSQLSLTERIKIINSFMNFNIEKSDSSSQVYDALNIAKILGMNENILTNAKKIISSC